MMKGAKFQKSAFHQNSNFESISHQSYENLFSLGLAKEIDVFSNLFETRETSEGLNAFLEKRKPHFR